MLDTAAASPSSPDRTPVRPPEPVTRAPRPLPGRTVLHQRWEELAYFHWRYPVDLVQRLLPPHVTVDAFDGDAWVGLIPFEMRDVRVGAGPVVPYLGRFIEINVRTYVLDALGRRGVWFFSLDVPRSIPVAVARTLFSLPYCWAAAEHDVEHERHVYRMRRRWPCVGAPTATIAFSVGEEIADRDRTGLDDFLTARWALITTRRGRTRYGPVHHPSWRLHRVGEVAIRERLIEAAGLPRPEGAPHALYSPGTGVEVGWLQDVVDGPSDRRER